MNFSTLIIIFLLITFFILLIISAFFSLSETAFFSINKTQLDYLIKRKDKRAISVFNIISEPDRLLGTILTGNNIVNVMISVIGTTVAIYFYNEWGVPIATIIVTIILLIFCETLPKVLATQFPEKFSLWIIRPHQWIRWVLSPIVLIIMRITYLFFSLFGMKIEYKRTIFTREEVKHIIKESGEIGALADGEHKLLNKIFDFSDKRANEIMIPREKIVAINADMDRKEIIRIVTEEGYTRYPLYRKGLDDIVGIIHAKTIINMLTNDSLFVVEDLMIRPYFVPEDKKISEILKEFQQKRLHIAIVKDNKNQSVKGLIQMEDILKVVFGELKERTVP